MQKSKRGAPTLRKWALWLALTVYVCVLSACGGASYPRAANKAAAQLGYADGEVAAESAPMAEPEAEPGAEPTEEGYSYEFEDKAIEAGGFGPHDARLRTTAHATPAPPKQAQNGQSTAQPQDPKASPQGTKPKAPAIASDAVPISQVLIYTARISMAVFEVAKALDEVEALARSLGGFLSRRTDNEITIRVPAAQFDDALAGIAKKGDVLTRNVQVEDVTEEYLDVMLRLKNARQVRERIAQLLANAKNVEESLQVERELSRLSAEIERLEGRLKYLRDRARYSTITVTFQPVRVDDVANRTFELPFPWLRELGLGRLMDLR